MLIIGLVGEKGSGKDTFSRFIQDIIKNQTIIHVRFSDLLKQTLNLWGLQTNRSNLQKLAQILEDGFGEGTMARAVKLQIQKINADIIILDGIRWKPDVDLLKNFTSNILVYITADPKLRFGRLKTRGEKDGESQMSFEQFQKEESAKNELLIPEIGSGADYKIINNTSIEDFKAEVEKFLDSKSI